MGAVVRLAEAVGVIKVLESANEPRLFDPAGKIGLVLQNSRERVGETFVFEDYAARHEIKSLRRFVVAQAEQRLVAAIADDQVDGDEWRQADHAAQFVMA